jgi:streptogramin lyase
MAAQELKCPNCGAPIDYDGSDVPTIRCPFCETSVVVPAELRPSKPVQTVQTVYTVSYPQPQYPAPARPSRVGRVIAWFVAVGMMIALGVGVLIYNIVQQVNTSIPNTLDQAGTVLTQISAAVDTPTPADTATPAPTPAPAFAQQQALFGSSGIGAGMLNDARYLAVDGAGTVYTADYMDGRIEAFNPDGKFLHGWQVGDEKTIIGGMTANHDGVVFIAYDGDIYRYEGATGKLLGKIAYANGPEFGDLAATADGGIIAAWYEGRWGLITSLDGHRDDLVWFDGTGKTLRTLKSFISGQTDDLALDTLVAVNGLGTIYAMDSGTIYKFTPQGKYLDKFPAKGDADSGDPTMNTIAVDGKGRIITASGKQVFVYNPDGTLIKSFPIDISAQKIALSESGDLYAIDGDQVARYTLGELP